ncbi:hypothetical protein FE257_001519 [Aspergillus nanangensis]|uniref:Uncharacterized protein n=1 Tax=Aspergillus nanangensis TaxID=2582783 RepID=A0AAD4CTG7_ASPNN|nr:hypothetical protein FE257_001519 [Aspergillus nanangensis]
MPSQSTSSPSKSSNTSPETLESDLLAHLASTAALDDLHATLLCSLQRTGWTEKIRRLSQELLRAGRCERFDEVVEAVVASAEGRKHPVLVKEENGKNNNSNNGSNGDSADGFFDTVDVRIPEAVVQQGVRAIKEVLREVVVLEDDPDLMETNDKKEEGTEKSSEKSKRSGDQSGKNGDTSPFKKEKKLKTGKQGK